MPPIGCDVLDAGGHLKAFQAEDGLAFAQVLVWQAKAWGSLGGGTDSEQIAERYVSGGPNPGFINALNVMTGGKVVPLAGGILIRDSAGTIIGGVGVSGTKPDEDAICARAGVDVCGLYPWENRLAGGCPSIGVVTRTAVFFFEDVEELEQIRI